MNKKTPYFYSPYGFIQGQAQTPYQNMQMYIQAILREQYQDYYNDKAYCIKIHYNVHNSLVYVLIENKLNNKVDLDIFDFFLINQRFPHLKNKGVHHFGFIYLNVNHNPNYLSAPEFMIKKCLNQEEQFTSKGKTWLKKMNSILNSYKLHNHFVKELESASVKDVKHFVNVIQNLNLSSPNDKTNNDIDLFSSNDIKDEKSTNIPVYLQEKKAINPIINAF